MGQFIITVRDIVTGESQSIETENGYFILTDRENGEAVNMICHTGGNLGFRLACVNQSSKISKKAFTAHLGSLEPSIDKNTLKMMAELAEIYDFRLNGRNSR